MINQVFEKTLETVDCLVVVVDRDLRIVLSNWKDHEWVAEKERLRQPYCYEVFKHFKAPCKNCPALKTFKDGKDRFYEDRNPIDGSYKKIRVMPILNDKHEVEYVLENVKDVTLQKESAEDKERLQNQLIQASKMESLGRLAGGIAHDFNNMLSVILGRTELIMSEMDQTNPVYKDLNEIQKSGQRSAELIRQLLGFARKQTISPIILDINKTIAGMLSMMRKIIGEDIELIWKPSPEVWPIKIDPVQIDQIIANLCINSRDALSKGGKIIIKTDTAILDEAYCAVNRGFKTGQYTLLSVTDNGYGMDEKNLEHIFEPFFTTKESGRGTGLGLATVYGIVKQNNGFIKVRSKENEGTSFEIFFPKINEKIVSGRNKSSGVAMKGEETILVVEDEDSILSFLKSLLKRLGYKVFTARTPKEAIKIYKEQSALIHLVLSDVVMPEMTGKELLLELKKIQPDLQVLFMSGYSFNVITHQEVLDEDVNFLQKPFSNKILAKKIREILDNQPL